MRIRKKKWIDNELEESQIYIEKEDLQKSIEEKVSRYEFKKIEMEIGCGKGKFISKLASKYEDVLYIAVDVSNTMLGMANKKIREEYKEKNISLNNIILVKMNAEYIEKYLKNLDENLKIDRIYLNFSNPWPKKRHKKRRLTHPRQMLQYLNIMKDNSEIYIKTDDKDFFEDSLIYALNVNKFSYRYKKEFDEYIENNKEELLQSIRRQLENLKEMDLLKEIILPELFVSKITNDLKKENIFEENIETEHEIEFSNEGKKIYAAIISRRK